MIRRPDDNRSQIDIPPTILDLFGYERVPERWRGMSFYSEAERPVPEVQSVSTDDYQYDIPMPGFCKGQGNTLRRRVSVAELRGDGP